MALLFPAFVIGMIVLAVSIVVLLLLTDPAEAHIKGSIARWTAPPASESVPAYDHSSAPTEVIIIPAVYRQAGHRPRFQPGALHPALRDAARRSALRHRLADNPRTRTRTDDPLDEKACSPGATGGDPRLTVPRATPCRADADAHSQ